MAIGGSPRSRRVTAWHHTCCNTIRWSAQRICDLCGTRADFWCDGVPIYILMERLHAEDKQERVDAPPSAIAAPAPARPPSARPHRYEDDEERPAPLARRILLADRRMASHTMWLAGAIALVSALFAVESVDRGQDPLMPLVIAVAAILVVVFVPVRLAVVPGQGSR